MENGMYRMSVAAVPALFSSACGRGCLPAGYGTIDFRRNLVYYLNGISD